MNFHYSAINRAGERLTGEIDASSQKAAINSLRNMGHLPVSVVQRGAEPAVFGVPGGINAFGQPSAYHITLFTRELAMLLRAGMPLDQSLRLLRTDAASKRMSAVIGRLSADISSGKSFSEALTGQGAAFPPFYTSMVRVAEASGTLETVLERIAVAREKAQSLRSKALSQLLYPCMLIVMAIAAVVVMLTFVVPKFKDMITQSASTVPEQARLVIAASDWLVANGLTLLAVIGIAIASIAVAWQLGIGKARAGQILLRLPLVGHALKLALTVNFCRGLGIMLENGVELPAAIKLLRDTVSNPAAVAMLDDSYDALRKGKSFLEPISNADLFPPVVVNLLRVGEETGGLSQSCLHLAEMFENKLELYLQRALTILEPLIILFVSAFIAGIIIVILGAVMSINDLAI